MFCLSYQKLKKCDSLCREGSASERSWTEIEGSPKSALLGQGPSLDWFTSRESVLKKTHHVGKTGSKYFEIYDQFSLLVTLIAGIPSQPWSERQNCVLRMQCNGRLPVFNCLPASSSHWTSWLTSTSCAPSCASSHMGVTCVWNKLMFSGSF